MQDSIFIVVFFKDTESSMENSDVKAIPWEICVEKNTKNI